MPQPNCKTRRIIYLPTLGFYSANRAPSVGLSPENGQKMEAVRSEPGVKLVWKSRPEAPATNEIIQFSIPTPVLCVPSLVEPRLPALPRDDFRKNCKDPREQ